LNQLLLRLGWRLRLSESADDEWDKLE